MKLLRVAGVLFLCGITSGFGQTNASSNAVVNVVDPAPPEGMAFIPGGTFQMGDSFEEGDSDELPVHSVHISGFYMDKHEVTKALWDEVHRWAVTNGYRFENAGSGKAANHPAHTVSWFDCVKWCNARSEKEGRTPCYNLTDWSCDFTANGYRLPTEAEWEKAARGGLNGKQYGWGDSIDHGKANYDRDPAYSTGEYPYTRPVGSFAPNGYGLHDMEGNVWEWCGDGYDSAYYATSPPSNPRGASTDSNRVVRGGCWCNDGGVCRSAFRNWGGPSDTIIDLGFRAVLPAKP